MPLIILSNLSRYHLDRNKFGRILVSNEHTGFPALEDDRVGRGARYGQGARYGTLPGGRLRVPDWGRNALRQFYRFIRPKAQDFANKSIDKYSKVASDAVSDKISNELSKNKYTKAFANAPGNLLSQGQKFGAELAKSELDKQLNKLGSGAKRNLISNYGQDVVRRMQMGRGSSNIQKVSNFATSSF